MQIVTSKINVPMYVHDQNHTRVSKLWKMTSLSLGCEELGLFVSGSFEYVSLC